MAKKLPALPPPKTFLVTQGGPGSLDKLSALAAWVNDNGSVTLNVTMGSDSANVYLYGANAKKLADFLKAHFP